MDLLVGKTMTTNVVQCENEGGGGTCTNYVFYCAWFFCKMKMNTADSQCIILKLT